VEPSRKSVEQTGRASEKLRLVIQHEDGSPVKDARVAIFRGVQVSRSGTTDRSGAVEFPPIEVRAEIAILKGPMLLSKQMLEPGAGERVLRIPMGGIVSGSVTVDGATPTEPLELTLSSFEKLAPERTAPPFLADFFNLRLGEGFGMSGTTASGGAFRFYDLPENWHGYLGFPPGYVVEGAGPLLSLPHPRTGLLVALRRAPAIVGRVIAPRDGKPVSGAGIRYELSTADFSQSAGVESDDHGRFRIPLPREAVQKAALEFLATGVGRLSLSIDDVDPERGKDLGDVLLKAVRDLPFRVLDEKGAPIRNAVARLGDRRSPPTGPDGEGALSDLPAETVSVAFDALGFEEAVVPAPPALDSRMEVTLHRGCRLEVLLRTGQDQPIPGLILQVRSEGTLFRNPHGVWAPDSQAALGATTMAGGQVFKKEDGSIRKLLFHFRGGTAGRVLLSGLRPSIPFDLVVRGPAGRSLAEVAAVKLARGEWRSMKIQVSGVPRTVRGRVVDGKGNPVPNAMVQMQESDSGVSPRTVLARTDNDGRFQAGGLYAELLDFKIQREGFAVAVFPRTPVSSDGREIRMRLEEGRTVLAEAVDPAGARVVPDRIEARNGSLRLVSGRKLEEGRFRLEDLPSGKVDLVAAYGGREFTLSHSTGIPEAVFHLPATASVLVSLDGLSAEGLRAYLDLVPLNSPGDRLRRTLSAESLRRGEVRFPAVLPGSYRCRLFVANGPEGEAPPFLLRSESKPVEVVAGRQTRILLEPPGD